MSDSCWLPNCRYSWDEKLDHGWYLLFKDVSEIWAAGDRSFEGYAVPLQWPVIVRRMIHALEMKQPWIVWMASLYEMSAKLVCIGTRKWLVWQLSFTTIAVTLSRESMTCIIQPAHESCHSAESFDGSESCEKTEFNNLELSSWQLCPVNLSIWGWTYLIEITCCNQLKWPIHSYVQNAWINTNAPKSYNAGSSSGILSQVSDIPWKLKFDDNFNAKRQYFWNAMPCKLSSSSLWHE